MKAEHQDQDGSMEVIATLVPTRFGTYTFEFEDTQIHHPGMSPCGRFWVGPAHYGFAVVDLGDGEGAWEREFRLGDGTPVTMLVTQEATAELEAGKPVEIVVYRDEGRWLNWLQDEGSLDDSPPRDIKQDGWDTF